jgi:hypothetical protein
MTVSARGRHRPFAKEDDLMFAQYRGAAAAGAALLVPLLAWTPPMERVKVSGRHTMTVVQQQQVVVGDQPAHVLLLAEARGTNENTGPTPWMERSTLVSASSSDLVAGNGPQQGYILEVEDGDTAYVRWSGRVTTTLPAGKAPVTTFEGQWTKTGGSGAFSGITGTGTYAGRFTSPTQYTTEWKGEIDTPKGYTAAR